MIFNHITIPLCLTLPIVLPIMNGFIIRRAAELAQPYRLRMAELGRKLLESPISAEDKKVITFSLDHAFNGWIPIALILAVPIAVTIAGWKLFRHGPEALSKDISEEQKEFHHLALISDLAANPVFGFIAAIEGVFLVSILALVFFTYKGVVIKSAATDVVRTIDNIFLMGRNRSQSGYT